MHWDRRNGTITIIKNNFKLGKENSRTIRRTFQDIIEHSEKCEEYAGDKNRGKPKLKIKKGSYEETLIAIWMTSQLGFRMTTHFVNELRLQDNQGPVSKYTVMQTFYRMKPINDKILQVQSGGNNIKWQIARNNFATQVSIMFGTITEDDVMIENGERVYGPIQIWFSKKNLT